MAPIGQHFVAGELGVLQQPCALRPGQLGEQLAVEVPVDEPVAGAVQAGADVIAAHVGKALGDPRGVEHHRVLDPELALHRDAALEARRILVGVADAQVAVAREAQPVVALSSSKARLLGTRRAMSKGSTYWVSTTPTERPEEPRRGARARARRPPPRPGR